MLAQKILETLFFNVLTLYTGIAAVTYLLIKVFRNGIKIFNRKDIVVPPALLSDQNLGTHHYLHLKDRGVKLHYVEAGDTNMPLLLCLHGFPECWFSWRHQLKEFSSQFRVVAVDLRGYGDSDKTKQVSDYSFSETVEDIKSFIQELEPVDGKCSLMGHDWGGTLAWKFVEKYPHLIHRHISINSPHSDVMTQLLKSSFSHLKKFWYIFLFQFPFLPELMFQMNDFEELKKGFKGSKSLEESFTEEILDVYKYYWAKEGGIKYPIWYYKMALKTVIGRKISNEKIIPPTLIVWGKQDSAFLDEIPKRMTQLCSDIQLKYIETAGHFPHEEEPVAVNKMIWNYIQITQ